MQHPEESHVLPQVSAVIPAQARSVTVPARDFANDAAAGYEVAIVGGGIIGTALLYVLSRYTNVSRIVLLEKHNEFAMVNSSSDNNSQTLHFGDIETHYTLEKAREVKRDAEMLVGYLERYGTGMFRKGSKMVLGVGATEVKRLEERYEVFKGLFPKLRKLGWEDVAAVEPNVVKGRNLKVPILALQTDDGYAVNYQKVAESFVTRAREENGRTTGSAVKAVDIHTGVSVSRAIPVREKSSGRVGRYILETSMGDISARVIIFASGPHSLAFAKRMGYGKDLGILPVAGNFYSARNVLKGKVYMMQIEGMPFASVHGDPNVNDPSETRFGPTVRVLPLLERHDWSTFRDFICTSVWNVRGVLSLLKIGLNPKIFRYTLNNLLFDLPLVGKWFFVCWEVCKIVPSLKSRDVTMLRGKGGIRPQVVNTKTGEMEFGEAEILGENVIFNITPSPGASVCLKNAEEDTEKTIRFLGEGYAFDKERLLKDLALPR